jgi:hypothetical protein
MRLQLFLKRIPQRNLVYVPSVASVWDELQRQRVDLYISSFPNAGALTLVEAMGAGVPIAIHRHSFSRYLSCIDLAYEAAFVWRTPEELLEFCDSVGQEQLKAMSDQGRAQYERYHNSAQLPAMLEGIVPDPNVLARVNRPYPVEVDEWAYFAQRQNSLARLTARGLIRFAKRIRAQV